MSRIGLSVVVLSLLSACGAERGIEASPSPEAPSHASTVAPMGGEQAVGYASGTRAELVLVRTASVSVSVEQYEVLRDELGQWLSSHGGHVADENVVRNDGRASWADLRLRVPASDFDALVGWLQREFPVEQLQVTAADVTAEWVDLEARVRSYRASEERLLSLVADRTATLADVLAAETELARVRSEIESLEGRRRVLSDQVSLASVALHVNVRTPFVAAVADPLSSRAGRAFAGSVSAMGAVARGTVVACAALAPWLVVFAGFATVGTIGLRRMVGRAVRST